MLSTASRRIAVNSARCFSTSKQNKMKVAVIGASGGIGQPLSLLLKRCCLISKLSLYDIRHTPGVAADLSHIDTLTCVRGYVGPEQLDCCLKCADVVVIPAGVPRKPGMTRDDLFTVNATIIKTLADSISKNCPKACIAIITNPVNSVVPIAAEVMKKNGTYDPKKLFGISTLDIVRTRTFIGNALNCDPQKIDVPVIGGHSGVTIIPVLSQSKPPYKASESEIQKLTARIQNAGTEIVKAKGTGSATLSMAHAGAQFVGSILKGLSGQQTTECSYVQSDVTKASFFATPLILGKNGIEKNCGLPKLSSFEQKLLEKALPELTKNIEKGVEFAKC